MHAVVRAAAARAIEHYDQTLALAIASDPAGPLVAHTDLFRELVLESTRPLLMALAVMPEPERDAAVGALLVSVFSQVLDRDIAQARARAEVPW